MVVLGYLKRIEPLEGHHEFPETVELVHFEYFFGRNAETGNGKPQIRLIKPYFSGTHAQLWLEEDSDGDLVFKIRDFSANGTFVNDNLVGKGNTIKLSVGDAVTFFKPKPKLQGIVLKYVFENCLGELSSVELTRLKAALKEPQTPMVRTQDQTSSGKRQRLEMSTTPNKRANHHHPSVDVTGLHEQLVQRTVAEAELRRTLEELRRSHDGLQEHLKVEEERAAEYLATNRTLSEQVAELQRRLAAGEAAAEGAAGAAAALERARGEAAAARADGEEQRRRAGELGRRLVRLQADLDRTGRVSADMEKQIALLQEDKEGLEQRVAEVAAQLIGREEAAAALKHAVAAREAHARELEGRLAGAQARERGLQERAAAAERAAGEQAQRAEAAEGEARAVGEARRLAEERARQVEALKVREGELAAAAAAARAEAGRAQGRAQAAAAAAAEARAELLRAREGLQAAQEQVSDYQATVASLKSELKDAQGALHSARQRVNELGGDLSSEEAGQRALKFDLEEARRCHRQAEAQREAALAGRRLAEGALSAFQSQVRRLRADVMGAFSRVLEEGGSGGGPPLGEGVAGGRPPAGVSSVAAAGPAAMDAGGAPPGGGEGEGTQPQDDRTQPLCFPGEDEEGDDDRGGITQEEGAVPGGEAAAGAAALGISETQMLDSEEGFGEEASGPSALTQDEQGSSASKAQRDRTEGAATQQQHHSTLIDSEGSAISMQVAGRETSQQAPPAAHTLPGEEGGEGGEGWLCTQEATALSATQLIRCAQGFTQPLTDSHPGTCLSPGGSQPVGRLRFTADDPALSACSSQGEAEDGEEGSDNEKEGSQSSLTGRSTLMMQQGSPGHSLPSSRLMIPSLVSSGASNNSSAREEDSGDSRNTGSILLKSGNMIRKTIAIDSTTAEEKMQTEAGSSGASSVVGTSALEEEADHDTCPPNHSSPNKQTKNANIARRNKRNESNNDSGNSQCRDDDDMHIVDEEEEHQVIEECNTDKLNM